MMLQDIEGRAVHFQPYGVAITKTTARKAGCNPVWYSHMAFEKGTFERFPITAINEIVAAAVADATVDGKINPEKLSEAPIFKLTPFFEQMGYTTSLRKEFWWEREWRHIGDFHLGPARIVAILAPAHDHASLRDDLIKIHESWGQRPILDPQWGLERMLVAMAGIRDQHIGPFPSAG